MWNVYLGYFLVSFFLSVVLTAGVYALMYKLQIVDRPRANGRKIHKKRIPLGGGLAIFLSFFAVAFSVLYSGGLLGNDITSRHLLGLFLGGAVLMVGGFLDDKYTMPAKHQIWFPVLAALLMIGFGIGPHAVSNPFGGGMLALDQWVISLGSFGNIILLADFLVFFWLMGMMLTTKLLDGLDGLVTGIVSIGAIMIFFVSRQPAWLQPEVGLLSLIFAGACLGFLLWNFYPAKIFLGQGGSLFTGFLLGSLAIISGSKIATTLLVVGIPMLDVLRVVIRRHQKKQSIVTGDKEHLHFQLLHSGFSQRQAVLLFYAIALLFGLTALFLQDRQQLIALFFLLALMVVAGFWVARGEQKKEV